MPPQSPPEPPVQPNLPAPPITPPPGLPVNLEPQQQVQPQPQQQQQVPQLPQQPYDFITHPAEPPGGSSSRLPGSDSAIIRGVYVAAGLLILLMAFILVRGILNRDPNLVALTGVVQDQQELIHLAANAGAQPGLSTNNQNFAATAKVSLTSSQKATIKYVISSGHTIKIATLNLKVSKLTDTELSNAAEAATYDQTFKTVMNAKLTTYAGDLQQTYKQVTDKAGRTVLNNNYKQTQLLITQLNSNAAD